MGESQIQQLISREFVLGVDENSGHVMMQEALTRRNDKGSRWEPYLVRNKSNTALLNNKSPEAFAVALCSRPTP